MTEEQQTEEILKVLNNSNFQTEIRKVYLEALTVGDSCLVVEEDCNGTISFRKGTKE